MFGDAVDGNVLNSFAVSSDNLMGVVTACFLFVATSTVPISNIALRISLHFMCFGENTSSDLQHLMETVSVVAVALVAAVFVEDVGMVFTFTGAVTSSMVSFIVPSVLYLWCHTVPGRTWLDVQLARAVLVLGLVIATVGLGAAMYQANQGGSTS